MEKEAFWARKSRSRAEWEARRFGAWVRGKEEEEEIGREGWEIEIGRWVLF